MSTRSAQLTERLVWEQKFLGSPLGSSLKSVSMYSRVSVCSLNRKTIAPSPKRTVCPSVSPTHRSHNLGAEKREISPELSEFVQFTRTAYNIPCR